MIGTLNVKRTLIVVLCVAVVISFMPLVPFVKCSAFGAEEDAAATIYKNGTIYTVEGKNWNKKPAKAMAISEDGKILGVGNFKALKKFKGEDTKVVDLKEKTVFPGFIDSHVHPPGTAMTDLFEINLYFDYTKKASMKTIKAFVAKNPDNEIYWGSGYNVGMFTPKDNPAKWLDKACADKPIIMSSNDGHNNLLNTKAMEMCGITKDSKAPTGGKIARDKDGNPNGWLTDAAELITLEEEFTTDEVAEGVDKFFKDMNSWGYTSCSSAGAMTESSEGVSANDIIINKAKADGGLPLRLALSNIISQDTVDQNFSDLEALKAKCGDTEDVTVTTAKFFIDGVVEGMTAYLSKPYSKKSIKDYNLSKGYKSEPMWEMDAYKEAMLRACKEGYQIHVHSVGDAATTMTVDAIEYAQENAGGEDYRNIITHLQVVDKNDIKRFKELGIVAATQPYWHMKEPDWYETVDGFVLGKKRGYNEYPLGSFEKAGVVVTASGDFPVSPFNDPFMAIEAGVTRNLNSGKYYGVDEITDMNDSTYLLNKKQRISCKDMMEAYTINGAYQMKQEDKIGSLKAGKEADFVVLSKDPLSIDPLKINTTKVLETFKSGERVN